MLCMLAGIFPTAVLGTLYPVSMPWAALLSFCIGAYSLWSMRRERASFSPRSKAFKEMQKIRRKQEKIAGDKHSHINDQIDYIASEWGYTREQERTIERFLEQRAYREIYNRFSASLLPQLIALVDHCNQRGRKGCKREVSRRIRELTQLMKEELKRKKSESRESFEVTLEVYDHLIAGGS